ncbi:MAG: acyl-CoA synthetase [Gemmatimonadetes bacterium]|nr:acyl-CoA synthetase [Gemmatimonadota bacterium]
MKDDDGIRGAFVFTRAHRFAERTAILDETRAWNYAELLALSARVERALLDGDADLHEQRVAFLVPPGGEWAAIQWGIWRAGGIAVPLAISHPPAELGHVIEDADASTIVVHPSLTERVAGGARARAIRVLETTSFGARDAAHSGTRTAPAADPAVAPAGRRPAMIVYTSGSTGRPKGVVTTHATITAQIRTLVEAWEWRQDDVALHVLPLHHVHGIINLLSCALWSGACCVIQSRFDALAVWQRFAAREITVFMAVPTIYHRLIAAWDDAAPEEREAWSAGARVLRLMVSGSAALPVPTLERWRAITGHTLLERYGMTEIGMALSNPLRGERVPGTVGLPLPGVEARLVDEQGRVTTENGRPGEIEIRGAQLFLEYWRRPDETAAAFRDGWFRTGDIAVIENGRWRILGRASVDIIKTGGYKVSAIEIEDALREHPDIADCAVIGVPDADAGERVCAAVTALAGAAIDAEQLREWAKARLAPYKVPREVRVLAQLPRNTMGKVTKPALRRLFS